MNATKTYQANRNEIDAKMARIQELLKTLDKDQAADPKNWGYAGSAGHVNRELNELIAFFGGKEA